MILRRKSALLAAASIMIMASAPTVSGWGGATGADGLDRDVIAAAPLAYPADLQAPLSQKQGSQGSIESIAFSALHPAFHLPSIQSPLLQNRVLSRNVGLGVPDHPVFYLDPLSFPAALHIASQATSFPDGFLAQRENERFSKSPAPESVGSIARTPSPIEQPSDLQQEARLSDAIAAPLSASESIPDEIAPKPPSDSALPLAPLAGENASDPKAPFSTPAPTAQKTGDDALANAIARLTPGLVSDRRKDGAGVAAFYLARNHAPLWLNDGRWTPAAHAALERLKRASEDGLDLSFMALPGLDVGDSDSLARQEIALSQAVAVYARQASGGRVEPARIGRLITAQQVIIQADNALGAISGGGEKAGDVLAAFNPPHPGYAALREKLAELRKSAPPIAHDRIPTGPVVKLGMRDARVPLIRQRFGVSPASDSGAEVLYDVKVAEAVADFQRANGLTPSGALTQRTVAALSGGEPNRLEGDIIASMEFWRWLPRDLGQSRIEVNIPSYGLILTRNGAIAHRTRVIVGKTTNPTPVFSNEMKYIIVNPYWNVPQSIIQKEMMPRLAADPGYLSRQGYEVFARHGKMVVRQPPGERNALGRIKFMFPNDHAVYLHDTSSRGLFASNYRALSHGCVRVDQPFRLAEAVLGTENGWSETRVKKMIGGAERTIFLPQPLPVHLEYFTTTVDERGQLKLFEDIYGYTHRMKQALGQAG